MNRKARAVQILPMIAFPYQTVIFMMLWNWHIAPLGLKTIGFLDAVALNMIVCLLSRRVRFSVKRRSMVKAVPLDDQIIKILGNDFVIPGLYLIIGSLIALARALN